MGGCIPSAPARVCAGLLVSVTLALSMGPAPAGAFTLRTVALSGDVAPGTGGATFLDFGPVVLNRYGWVAFTAPLEQGGDVHAGNDLGTWSEGLGPLALVQRQGSSAADTAVTWNLVTAPPVLNDAGQVAFRAFTNGGGLRSAPSCPAWPGASPARTTSPCGCWTATASWC